MTTIYNLLNDIFKVKSGKYLNSPDFNEAVASNYMLQRWISMDSPSNAYLINETTNKLWNSFENDKQMLYKLYLVLIDKQSYNKIKYIKKSNKVINEKRVKLMEILAKRNQISQREVEQHLELLVNLNKDIERFKEYVV